MHFYEKYVVGNKHKQTMKMPQVGRKCGDSARDGDTNRSPKPAKVSVAALDARERREKFGRKESRYLVPNLVRVCRCVTCINERNAKSTFVLLFRVSTIKAIEVSMSIRLDSNLIRRGGDVAFSVHVSRFRRFARSLKFYPGARELRFRPLVHSRSL